MTAERDAGRSGEPTGHSPPETVSRREAAKMIGVITTGSGGGRPRARSLSCASTPASGAAKPFGSTIAIYTRGLWINLNVVGFDNKTSSYQVGACAIELSSGPNGGGNRYPRCLYAGCTENTLLSGWNNTISPAYLH